MDWISQVFPNEKAKLLWIHGPAGFGKSTLSARIVEKLKEDSPLPIAYCFCSSSNEQREDSIFIVKTWLAQLFGAYEDFVDIVDLEMRGNPCHASNCAVWSLLTALVHKGPQCIFVVDGLDECAPESMDQRVEGYLDRA